MDASAFIQKKESSPDVSQLLSVHERDFQVTHAFARAHDELNIFVKFHHKPLAFYPSKENIGPWQVLLSTFQYFHSLTKRIIKDTAVVFTYTSCDGLIQTVE